jgi:hypothetical protein
MRVLIIIGCFGAIISVASCGPQPAEDEGARGVLASALAPGDGGAIDGGKTTDGGAGDGGSDAGCFPRIRCLGKVSWGMCCLLMDGPAN